MTIDVLPRATDDLVAGYHFYEQQEQDLGSYFRASLFADVDALRVTAGVHSLVWGYHRSVSKKFPFAIYYRFSGDVAQVHAILDCRRDPEFFQRTLENR